MGFEKFGQVSFAAQTKAAAFVEYLEKGELRGTKCKSCGRSFFPPRADCNFCLNSDMEWFEIKGQGNVISFTEVNYGPTGFETDVPYTLALVDFDGVEVFGRFDKKVPADRIKIGMAVKAVVNELPNGQISYEFLPE
ncbi:MAG: Zn-ribbon domain-containing OB-fold protein [Firmicutes bacterium]|nr:Zn-ribbon domain-containing OB-fold protein [Bacillota bacterium]